MDGWNPINHGINHLSTGAGFLPSTVSGINLVASNNQLATAEVQHHSMYLWRIPFCKAPLGSLLQVASRQNHTVLAPFHEHIDTIDFTLNFSGPVVLHVQPVISPVFGDNCFGVHKFPPWRTVFHRRFQQVVVGTNTHNSRTHTQHRITVYPYVICSYHAFVYIYIIYVYIYMHTHTPNFVYMYNIIQYWNQTCLQLTAFAFVPKKHIKPVIGRFLGTGFHPFPQRTTRPLQPATMRSPLPPTLALLVRPPQAQNPVASVHLARRDCFYDQNRQGYRDTEQCFHMFPQLIMIIPIYGGIVG